MSKVLNNILKYWWIYVLFFGIGGWVVMVEIGVAAGEKKDASQDEILAKQAETDLRQIALMEKMNGKIDVILQMLGLKVADSTVSRWKAMAKRPPLDSLGKPIVGAEWLCITSDYLVGRRMRWGGHDSVLVRVEWDESKHRSDST